MNIPRNAATGIAAVTTTCLAFLLLLLATVNHANSSSNDNIGSFEQATTTATSLRRFLPTATANNNSTIITLFDEDQDIPSLFPLTPLDYVGFTCMIVGLILAAGGGIGGGGILVPIYILIFDFPVKHSIPLASVTVFGGAIAK